MRLAFSGHTSVNIQRVALENLGRHCQQHRNTGCFRHHGRWTQNNNVLTVTFRPTIYLNSALSGDALTDAQAHEQRHYDDFLSRAIQLRSDLDRITRQRRRQQQDPEMRIRWRWFLYDLCRDSRAYHRSIGSPVEICITPASSRPR
jgi:hypothetical protein